MMKKLLILLTLLIGINSAAQEEYRTLEDQFDAEAKELANKYDNELGLTPQQWLLFKKEIEANLMKRAKIQTTYEGKEMLDQLVEMRQRELQAMGEILTRIQLDRYKTIRPELQPLAYAQQ